MLGVLRRHITIPLLDAWRGTLAPRYRREVGAALNASAPEIEAEQERKFRRAVLHAWRTVPFYRRRYAHLERLLRSEDWPEIHANLPRITKPEIREHNADFVSTDFEIGRLAKSGTGGTTSSPIDIYLDPVAVGKRQAATRFFMEWYGHRPGDKIAYLWGAPQDFPRGFTLKWRIVNALTYRGLVLSSAFLSDEVMSDYHRRLREFRPKIIQAYPTALFIFARFLADRGLSLEIPSVITTAEPLLPHQRRTIEGVFGTQVFDWYGARELGHAASECRVHRGFHVNAYGLRFEVLGADGVLRTEGEGELVVTDLENPCMPFVRYQIGDLGVLSRRTCPCGSRLPILESIVGRVADVFRRRDGSLVPGISMADRIITECTAIAEFQIVQTDFERFTLRIVKGEQFTERSLEEFKERIRGYMRTELGFDVEYLDAIPRERSGKIRFCVSLL